MGELQRSWVVELFLPVWSLYAKLGQAAALNEHKQEWNQSSARLPGQHASAVLQQPCKDKRRWEMRKLPPITLSLSENIWHLWLCVGAHGQYSKWLRSDASQPTVGLPLLLLLWFHALKSCCLHHRRFTPIPPKVQSREIPLLSARRRLLLQPILYLNILS